MTLSIVLSAFALLCRLVRPTRGLHVGPWRDRLERPHRVRPYVPVPWTPEADPSPVPTGAAAVRPYVLVAERQQRTARRAVIAHTMRLQRAALAEARAGCLEMEVAR